MEKQEILTFKAYFIYRIGSGLSQQGNCIKQKLNLKDGNLYFSIENKPFEMSCKIS